MKNYQTLLRLILWTVILSVSSIYLIQTPIQKVYAANSETEIAGSIYEFGEDNAYNFHKESDSKLPNNSESYGIFSINGQMDQIKNPNHIASYEVKEGTIDFFYKFSGERFSLDPESWHLVEDDSTKIAYTELDSKIKKGAIVIQTSKDRTNWVTVNSITNAFEDPASTDIKKPIYTAKDIELINGCYYRVLIAYQTGIRTKKGKFVLPDHYDYKKYAEVYELYAYKNSDDSFNQETDQTYNLGNKVRVKDFDAYYGSTPINKDDSHYGWNLGRFFLSGYSDVINGANDKPVFLKNAGDKVTLWFNLDANINELNGNKKLKVTADTDGYDQYFETPKMNFGKGALIIRHTDHHNIKNEPVVYTNYLEANTYPGVDMKVQLLEEGDYEVALDYEITKDALIDKVGHYRIAFNFSVRNGNSMAFLFDVKTGAELANNTITENGFRLDLAKSHYLKVYVKREVLKQGTDGLVEDTRFNAPAKDGKEYLDEGVNTITVNNESTNQQMVKKIYVGKDPILRAHLKTDLSIPEINFMVSKGARIEEDGTIHYSLWNTLLNPEYQKNTQDMTNEMSDKSSDTSEKSGDK